MTKGKQIFFGLVGAVGIYEGYKYYLRNYAIITDSSSTITPSIFDMSNYKSPDYRGQTSLPLGIQNNNPFNIRDVGIPWQGLVGSNQGFCVFIDLEHGIRAGIINLGNVIKYSHDGTIASYLPIYAPASENNTAAYIQTVSTDTGIDPNASLYPLGHDNMKALAQAHMQVENGTAQAQQYISDTDLEAGLSLTPYGAGVLS